MARRALEVLAVVALSLLAAATVRAELQPLLDGRTRIGERSLADVGRPERREARLLARDGLRLLLEASIAEQRAAADEGLEPSSQVRLEQALERLDRAVRVLDHDPDVGFFRAVALAGFVREEAGGRVVRRTDEAIAELLRVRGLEPTYEPAAVAWHLALLRARQREYALTAEEYERVRAALRLGAVPIAPPSDREVTLLGWFLPPPEALVALNQGEAEMLGERLEPARRHYDEAVAVSERGTIERALALFGRALVEERAGAHLEALATALDATRAWTPSADDPVAAQLVARHGPVAALHHPGVGFEPRWELHAYEALAHEALARGARTAREPGSAELADAQEERARRSLRAFFAVGGEASSFAQVAREGLRRLEAARPATR